MAVPWLSGYSPASHRGGPRSILVPTMWKIYGGQVSTRTGFSSSTSFFVCDCHCTSAPTFKKAALFRESGGTGRQSTFTSVFLPSGVKENGHIDSLYETVLQEEVIISQLVKELPTVKEPGIPLPCSHEPATCPYLSHINSNFQTSCPFSVTEVFPKNPSQSKALWNILWLASLLQWETVTPRSTPKLDYHHLSAVLNYLLNIFYLEVG